MRRRARRPLRQIRSNTRQSRVPASHPEEQRRVAVVLPTPRPVPLARPLSYRKAVTARLLWQPRRRIRIRPIRSGLARNDLCTFDWGEEKSTSEFGVGDVLEDKYDLDCHYQERVTIEVSVTGIVKWRGDDTDWNSSTTKRLTCSMSSTRFAFGQSTQRTATGCLRSHTQS